MLHNLAGSLREIKQKLEFLGCQMNFLLTNKNPVRLRINAKVSISITSGTASTASVLRRRWERTRANSCSNIVLSVRGEERGEVQALDVGRMTMSPKPFGMEELLARVRSIFAARPTP